MQDLIERDLPALRCLECRKVSLYQVLHFISVLSVKLSLPTGPDPLHELAAQC